MANLHFSIDLRIYKKSVLFYELGNEWSSDYYLMDALGKTVAILHKTQSLPNGEWEYFASGAERECRLAHQNQELTFSKDEVSFYLYDHLGKDLVATEKGRLVLLEMEYIQLLVNKMTLKEALNNIESGFELEDLFAPGPYKRFDSVERIYLDALQPDLKGLERFIFLLDYIGGILDNLFDSHFYVCIVRNTWENENEFPKKSIKKLKKGNIEISNAIYTEKYIENDEWYAHYLFFDCSKAKLSNFIWFCLSSSYSIEPFADCDIYLIDNELNYMINIYDDRGMDIMNLKMKQINP